ncbi:hypothetical protein QYM36_003901 [Artemia franciscana]|uniref:Uncharacterized protein n=1 Tax=Artemia franciscana TaxID=6661 RepID=A0AA88I5E5_ARTSF|nr:hypothetical protein QYM36_003901 [Artemia franciscana]
MLRCEGKAAALEYEGLPDERTQELDSNIKDEFYSILKDVIRAAPRYDIMCVLGDFDAKVGDDTEYASCVIGRHGVGSLNENSSL